MVGHLEDPRRTEPVQDGLGEREMLEAWLEFQRLTLLLKVEGLDDAARKARPVATSKLSLHGLVRHMAEVERHWFRMVLSRDHAVPFRWGQDDSGEDDPEMVPLDAADFGEDQAAWQEECAHSRQVAAGHGLDDTGVTREGRPCSLRWIFVHMIEEYARHNGHADLIRELVDGAVGWWLARGRPLGHDARMSEDHAVAFTPRPPETVLPALAPEIEAALTDAAGLPEAERRAAYARVAARWPRCLDAWASLAETASDPVEQYAYARVGYHRGLDALRGAGWRGSGLVRWAEPSNRGFLRSLAALAAAAGTIGEDDEEERCRLFLRQVDPEGPPH